MADSDKLSPKEIDARREAALKKLLATPPKPHKSSGKGQQKKAAPAKRKPVKKD